MPRSALSSSSPSSDDGYLGTTFGAVVLEEGADTPTQLTPRREIPKKSEAVLSSPTERVAAVDFSNEARRPRTGDHSLLESMRAAKALSRAKKQRRYVQQVSLLSAYTKLTENSEGDVPQSEGNGGKSGGGTRESGAVPPMGVETLTNAWRNIQREEAKTIQQLAAAAACAEALPLWHSGNLKCATKAKHSSVLGTGGGVTGSLSGATRLGSSSPSVVAPIEGLANILAALGVSDTTATFRQNLNASSTIDSQRGHGLHDTPVGAHASPHRISHSFATSAPVSSQRLMQHSFNAPFSDISIAPKHPHQHQSVSYDPHLLLVIRQLVLQQEDLASQLREAKARNEALLLAGMAGGTISDAFANGGSLVSPSATGMVSPTENRIACPPLSSEVDISSTAGNNMSVLPQAAGSSTPPLAPDTRAVGWGTPKPIGMGLDATFGGSLGATVDDALNSIAASTTSPSRGVLNNLREQIAQVHQRENDWRRQVNTLQLMVDDAREELEKMNAEHSEEVSKLQKTIDLLLQDIEMDMGESLGIRKREGGISSTQRDQDTEDKVRLLRKVRSAIQRSGGAYSPPGGSANAADDLHRHYECALSNAIKEETEILASSISDAAQLGSPDLMDKLQAAVRKNSMRRSQSMGVGMGMFSAGHGGLGQSVGSNRALTSGGLGASPTLSDRLSSSISVSQPTTPQRGVANGTEGTSPVGAVSPVPSITKAASAPNQAPPHPHPPPAPTVFHATNPNQIGDVTPRDKYDEQWMLMESIKVGLQAEVCKSILDHYEDSQKPTREGPLLSGIVKGLVSTVAAAASTVASTMTDPTAGADITQETTEYFCHLHKDSVVTRTRLPSSLPPLKVHNTNKQLLNVFHSINATYAPSPALGSAQSVGQGRLVCRGDQIRIRFYAPKCFAMIREKLGVDPEHLRLSIEQCDWRKASSPGKSEAVMFYFGDYVLKTVKNVESSFLKSTYIPSFTKYAAGNPHTLLPHFMTFFSITWLLKRQTLTFVLMKNVFSTRHYINAIYDLKGSTVGREAAREDDAGKSEVKRTAFGALLLKDNDLPQQLIYCGPLRRAVMIAQLQSDTNFLQSLNIVDYSLMVGVRSRVVSKGGSEEQRAAAYLDVDGSCIRSSNGGMLSLAIYDEHDMNTVREDTYYIGIIDCLQPYNSSKKLEHFAKGLLMYDRHKISVVPPEEYAERLCKLIDRITV